MKFEESTSDKFNHLVVPLNLKKRDRITLEVSRKKSGHTPSGQSSEESTEAGLTLWSKLQRLFSYQ